MDIKTSKERTTTFVLKKNFKKEVRSRRNRRWRGQEKVFQRKSTENKMELERCFVYLLPAND